MQSSAHVERMTKNENITGPYKEFKKTRLYRLQIIFLDYSNCRPTFKPNNINSIKQGASFTAPELSKVFIHATIELFWFDAVFLGAPFSYHVRNDLRFAAHRDRVSTHVASPAVLFLELAAGVLRSPPEVLVVQRVVGSSIQTSLNLPILYVFQRSDWSRRCHVI